MQTIPDAYIERGLSEAVALGVIAWWVPQVSRVPGSDPGGPKRQWLLAWPDGRRERMPAGAAWAFVRGVRQGADATVG